RGRHGEGSDRHGRSGDDVVIQVPAGTLVRASDDDRLLADLREPGDREVVAAGGQGGRGNTRFATSRQRAPRRSEPGRPGDELWLKLELRLLADVGLVGLPNAGKSTLISRLSQARPKIADYPFTTLVPQLGVVEWDTYRSHVWADLPGLIAGASAGQGLGHQFLRHVDRTAVLLHLVDVSEGSEPGPEDAVTTIEDELRAFDASLLGRPRLLVASKIDSQGDGEVRAELERVAAERELPFFAVSAVTGDGLAPLVRAAADRVEELRKLEQPEGSSAEWITPVPREDEP
ncbi:MAG: Obg family GTPase CgtA, partial [Acidobacteriota bacterium]